MPGETEQAVEQLRKQGFNVILQMPKGDGEGFGYLLEREGKGYFLTRQQLLHLETEGKLTKEGIRQFDADEAATTTNDVISAQAEIGIERMRSWTAREICEFINRKFNRIHSIGQTAAILEKLHYSHKESA